MEYKRYCIVCGKEKIYNKLDSFRANKDSLLCRSCARKIIQKKNHPNKLEKLLEETAESYYWIGYLLADGHFSEKYRVTFVQNNEDKISVEKFKNYIETETPIVYKNSNGIDKASISVMNVDVIKKLMEKFDIKSNKTYNPPDKSIFEKMDIDMLSYLFIGFVDGDGNIGNLHKRKDFHLRIKVHSSWFDILDIFSKRIFGLEKHTKINNQGYADFNIGDTQLLKQFKKKYVKNLNFEPLNRKWDVIDLNYISRNEKAKADFESVSSLYEHGYNPKQICKELNLKEGKVYKIICKIKENDEQFFNK